VLIYALYAVPMALYVIWPDRLRLRRATARSRSSAPAESPA
jgi:hypothetical protein